MADDLAPLKVLACHSYYQLRGGEDECYEAEVRLLEARGHEVARYELHNDTLSQMSGWQAAAHSIWNRPASAQLEAVLERERPDVVHFTNTFPLLSPAAYYPVKRAGVPLVHSLHNYRLLCLNGLLARQGGACEDCVGRTLPWPGIVHRCYRGDLKASAATALMMATHRALGTWRRQVDLFVTPSVFTRDKLVEGGVSRARIRVKPNFLEPDPGPGSGHTGDFLFVGRLSEEKGVDTLLDAWRCVASPAKLRIVGDGPLAPQVRAAQVQDERIEWLGRQPHAEVIAMLGEARCALVPSRCYEVQPRSIVEAFARGTPVIAPRLGALSEAVEEGVTGWQYAPDDPRDLARSVERAVRTPMRAMRERARQCYLARYTPESNYKLLIDLYEEARAIASARRR